MVVKVHVDHVASCFTMATPSTSLVNKTSDIINCVAIFHYEKGSSENSFLLKEKFRTVLRKTDKTLSRISLVVVVVLLIVFSHLIVISVVE